MHDIRERVPQSGPNNDENYDPKASYLKSITSRSLIQEAKIRWSLMSLRSRCLATVVLPILAFYLLCGSLDFLFLHFGSRKVKLKSNTDNFAVIINTYKRPKMLKDAVQHYAETCGRNAGVSQVFVIWAELEVTPPQPESFFQRKRLKKNRSDVKIVRVEKDSLNSRFLPISDLQTDSIFMVDDDVRVDCFSLKQGFTAWRSSPNTMVGYYPRLSIPPRSKAAPAGDLVYQSWPMVFWKQKMNFILTKASFLHRKYMDLYSSTKHPQEIKDYVDKYFNCEDVAMSLLVANHTKSQGKGAAMPIYVEGSVSDKGLFGGISTGTGHMARRSDCLTDLTKIYRKHGWPTPLDETFDLRKASWIKHTPGFRSQIRPSNVFEWFALENVLK